MNTLQPQRTPAGIAVVVTLARLLEKLEQSATPVSADQYRWVARSLADAMGDLPDDAVSTQALNATLAMFPAAAEVYENRLYEHAGLCRAPLDRALGTEIAARELIARVSRRDGVAGLSSATPGRTG